MENLNKISEETRNKLRAPFPEEAYSTIESKSYLTSIKAMYIIERLNDVFGIGNWTFKHEVILMPEQSNDFQVLIKGQLILSNYDCLIPEQYGSHKTKGKGVELADGFKSAITDAITKSASYIEIGIDVFKGKIKPPKKTYNNKEKIEIWLSKTQYEAALNCGKINEIENTLKAFGQGNTKKRGMKIEYKNALEAKLMELKSHK